MGERSPLLNEVIADEAEAAALRVDDGLLAERAVGKMKGEAAGHPLAPGGLDQIAVGELGTVERLQHEEAANDPLRVPDFDLLGGRTSKGRESDEEEHRGNGSNRRPPLPGCSYEVLAGNCLIIPSLKPSAIFRICS